MNDLKPGNSLTIVTLEELLNTSFRRREEILGSLIMTQSLNMFYAWRGVGKTHVALGVAHAVSAGGWFLKWKAPKPRPILYLDGEMPGRAIQERLQAIVDASGKDPPPGFFQIATPDLQEHGVMPDLSTYEGQNVVDAMIKPEIELIVVDNISCLCRSGKENESESWIPVQGWALKQRAAGRAVLFIHHSGKNGDQRGASKREDILDTVVKLKRPADYEPSDGAAFELIFEKARHLTGSDTSSIEARLTLNEETELQEWVYKDTALSTFDRVVNLANDGFSQIEIANELQINKSNVCRHLKKAVEQGLIQVSMK